MRKVFLDELPRYEEGINKGRINWEGCVGVRISFICDDIKGDFEVLEYKKADQMLVLKYKNEIFNINTGNFSKCKIYKIVNKHNGNFKIEIGQVIKDGKRDIIIIDREYRYEEKKPDKKGRVYTEKKKYYKYKCNKCGNEDWLVESNITSGNGCRVCIKTGNKKPKLGINTIWDTDRWMVNLGVSEKDAKTHTSQSNQKIEIVCPDCGNKFKMIVCNIYKRRATNCNCKDGNSYPEKFVYRFISQLNIELNMQYSPCWADKKKYDFYLPEYNMIIETHGIQHYEKSNRGRTLEEEQENDRLKEQLAKNNGVENYIVLDCRYSDLDYIKNSILNSELAKLFDLSKIDWLKCEEFALSNLVKEVCNYWNNKEEWETIQTIAKNNKLGINGVSTVRKYLKKGTRLGWCSY